MLSTRFYSLALGGVGLALSLGLLALALYLVPLWDVRSTGGGNLARIGWYSKNHYGPNAPQRAFRPSLLRIGETIDRPYDVVVLGDSFSLDPDRSWPNYLAARGLSVLAIPLARDVTRASDAAAIAAQIETLLASPGFAAYPPRVLVLQMVEATLHRNLVETARRCAHLNGENGDPRPARSGSDAHPAAPLAYGPPPPVELQSLPPDTRRRLDDQQITYARDFLWRNVQRLLSRFTPDVKELRLLAPRFSSDRQKSLLVFAADLSKDRWSHDDLDQMRCRLLAVQRATEANGTTLFVALLIPDKLSAYHADLLDPSPSPGVIERLRDPRLNEPRVDEAIRRAIDAGDIDVYLPDDTHFGLQGHAVTANIVMEFIEGKIGAKTVEVGVASRTGSSPSMERVRRAPASAE